MPNPEHKSDSLKHRLLDRIESEHLKPRSRLFFRGRECGVWFLWCISVVLGALAVAVSLFAVSHRQYGLYEATHNNYFTFLVDVLPFLWFFVFAAMAIAAVYYLRHTKRGYRYPAWMVIMSSVVVSFALGSALQFFGLGYLIDTTLGHQMTMYMSQEKLEHRLWQRPEDGRLIGQQVLTTVSPTTTVVFSDVKGTRWRMEVVDLFPRDRELLANERLVRVIGQVQDERGRVFHACGVFPWMLDPAVTMADLSRERQAFLDKVSEMKRRAEERVAALEAETFAPSTQYRDNLGVCAELAVMKRMERADELE